MRIFYAVLRHAEVEDSTGLLKGGPCFPWPLLGEEDADGGRNVDDRAALVAELAGFGVDTVGGHGVGVGPGREQEGAASSRRGG